MDIIDVALKVALVAYGVLPKPPLPKREIAIRPAPEMEARIDQCGAEMPFDSPPTAREICIGWRQGKDGVQMIRENHDGVDRKWPGVASCAERQP